ncbi:hypothetical protein BCBBV1cgp29 [Bacillus phage BCASJ1c]|uniref:29 n=1 Tax=Bacillus phage BCASJ1c TaxID=294382 RepID=Q5YA81_9CAUD|nr:hypothetical protein BCBBV1cgp29 [Bacillus phage BCASJ1c]AAU85076.1 29 [Bacillus phage BCASJ1c]
MLNRRRAVLFNRTSGKNMSPLKISGRGSRHKRSIKGVYTY